MAMSLGMNHPCTPPLGSCFRRNDGSSGLTHFGVCDNQKVVASIFNAGRLMGGMTQALP